jgi:hypothetical protein
MKLTLTQTIQQLQTWIEDTQFDLSQDWLSETERNEMQMQLQNLIIAKANLEALDNLGGQIFRSSISK